MCQECLRAVYRWFPEVDASEYHHILYSLTAFPFGGPVYVESQLQELRELTEQYGWRTAQKLVHESWDIAYDKMKCEEQGIEWDPFTYGAWKDMPLSDAKLKTSTVKKNGEEKP